MSAFDFKYGKAAFAIGTGQIDLLTSTVDAMLVSSGYAPRPTLDEFVSDIPSSSIIVRDAQLGSLGITSSGVFYGTIPAFNALTSALTVAALVLYIKAASDATSQLLYYSSGGPGFPFLPQGFNYVVTFDQANGGFFQI